MFQAGFEEGLIPDMADEHYHKLHYTSNSFLSDLFEMYPEEAHYRRLNPKKETDSQKFGTAAHFAILQPELFESRYIIAPKCQAVVKSTGQPCKNDATVLYKDGQWLCGVHGKDEALKADEQPNFIGKEDRDKVCAIRDKVWADRRARSLLERSTLREVTMLFKDPMTGMRCKGRLDAVDLENGIINDVKTTVNLFMFSKSFYDWGYHRQNAFYRFGASVLYQKGIIKKPLEHFNFIVVDKEAPHVVGVCTAPDDQYELAMQQLRPLMDLCHRCETNNIWPGHGWDWESKRAIIEDIRISDVKVREIQRNANLGDLNV